jgi:hypothetical protein
VKLLPKILADEDEVEEDRRQDFEEGVAGSESESLPWRWTAALAARAAVPRLLAARS